MGLMMTNSQRPSITIALLPSSFRIFLPVLVHERYLPQKQGRDTNLRFHSTKAGNLVVRTTWHLSSQERGGCSEHLGYYAPPALRDRKMLAAAL